MSRMPLRPVRYHLRATVTPQQTDAQAEALYRLVRAGRIDEIMFFVPHAEEMSPGLGTEAECREARERIRPMFEELRRMGVKPSINIWWTLSFSNFGLAARDLRDRFQFRWAVGAAGRSDHASPCPIDENWRREAQRLYAAFAELKPATLWIDDDVNASLRGYIRSACFCPACLDRAAQYTGKPLDRDALVKAVLADPPNAVRDQWLRFQRDILLEIVSGLRDAVHRVSPDTRVGVMHSGMEEHFAQGRRWGEHLAAACSPHPVLARPTLGTYSEGAPADHIAGFNATRFAQAVAGEHDDLAPEIENYPQTGFNKSRGIVRAHMTLCQALGLPEITLSILRFGGRVDLDRTEGWARTLHDLKPKLQAIADLGITRAQQRGIGLFWHERVASFARGCQGTEPFSALRRRRPWDDLLCRMGFATRYHTWNAPDPSGVTACAGEAIAGLSLPEREALYARGLLLDARAAAAIIALGEGEMIGLARVLDPVDAVLESIEDADFGEKTGDTMNLRLEGGRAAQFMLLKDARVISRVHSYGLRPTGHGITLFVNKLGGRVAVFPFDGQFVGGLQPPAGATAPVFQPSWTRQAQFRGLLAWLGAAPPELFIPDAPNALAMLAEQPKRLIATVANFNSDAIGDAVLELRPTTLKPRRVRVLAENGRWKSCKAQFARTEAGALRVRTACAVRHLDVAVFEIT